MPLGLHEGGKAGHPQAGADRFTDLEMQHICTHPLVSMVSYSLVHYRGPENFITEAKDAGFSGAMLALAPMHSILACSILLFLLGGSFTLLTANANALVQLDVPGHLRGRVVGLYLFAFAGLAPVGGLVAGWLVAEGGTALAFGVAGATGLAIALYAIGDRERLRASLARAG